jgi:hypothetical protein
MLNQLSSAEGASRIGTLGLTRRRLINGGLALLLGGSLYDIVTGQEHWPFSPYRMYSRVDTERSLTALRLFGVTAGRTPREVQLRRAAEIAPFDQARLEFAFRKLRRRPNGRARLHEAVRDCLERYETRRAAGRHDGPPLRGARLYELRWRLDPRARNVDRPEERTLLVEVHRSD